MGNQVKGLERQWLAKLRLRTAAPELTGKSAAFCRTGPGAEPVSSSLNLPPAPHAGLSCRLLPCEQSFPGFASPEVRLR